MKRFLLFLFVILVRSLNQRRKFLRKNNKTRKQKRRAKKLKSPKKMTRIANLCEKSLDIEELRNRIRLKTNFNRGKAKNQASPSPVRKTRDTSADMVKIVTRCR